MGCARFAQNWQNFSERHILWSLCLVVFHALTLKSPIQTSFSVVPKLPVSLSLAENCHKFRKRVNPRSTCCFMTYINFQVRIQDLVGEGGTQVLRPKFYEMGGEK